MIEDCAKQAGCEQKQVGKCNVSFECGVKLLLEAIQPEDADRIGTCQKDSHMVVLLICCCKDVDCRTCEGSTGHWMGDRPPFQEVMVNVKPFTNC